MTDLVQRLRDSATQARALDRAALLEEAAEIIESQRLLIDVQATSNQVTRERYKITDEELDLILFASNMIERDVANVSDGKVGADARRYVKGLRRLLKRLK